MPVSGSAVWRYHGPEPSDPPSCVLAAQIQIQTGAMAKSLAGASSPSSPRPPPPPSLRGGSGPALSRLRTLPDIAQSHLASFLPHEALLALSACAPWCLETWRGQLPSLTVRWPPSEARPNDAARARARDRAAALVPLLLHRQRALVALRVMDADLLLQGVRACVCVSCACVRVHVRCACVVVWCACFPARSSCCGWEATHLLYHGWADMYDPSQITRRRSHHPCARACVCALVCAGREGRERRGVRKAGGAGGGSKGCEV
jgi:hypothetical protein